MNSANLHLDPHTAFLRQRAFRRSPSATAEAMRVDRLHRLLAALEEHAWPLRYALQDDLARNAQETSRESLDPMLYSLKEAIRCLPAWVGTPRTWDVLLQREAYRVPFGSVLILPSVSDPVQTILGPLIAALAAGNTVMVRPSSRAPATALVFRDIITSAFRPEEVHIVGPQPKTLPTLLRLPFDHVVFSGTSQTARQIQLTRAKYLGRDTFHVGLPSPVVIGPNANLHRAAAFLLGHKSHRSGRHPDAPDAVFVHPEVHTGLIDVLQDALMTRVDERSEKFHSRQRQRLRNLLAQAITDGAVLVHGQASDDKRHPSLTILSDIPFTSDLASQEVHGPLLPLVSYGNEEALIDHLYDMGPMRGLTLFGVPKEMELALTRGVPAQKIQIEPGLAPQLKMRWHPDEDRWFAERGYQAMSQSVSQQRSH